MKTSALPSTETSQRFQWCSLAEFTGADQGFDPGHNEFPEGASEWSDGISRRRFLEVMAASIAMAGAAGCTRQPREEIVPYVRKPEALTEGKPLFFATAMDFGGSARGMLVRSDEGRPTKIEGNPEHPASLGRSSVHMQAALLELYDPDRSDTVMHEGETATWEGLLETLTEQTARWKQNGGTGVRLLTRRIGSPTLQEQIQQFLKRYPQARWYQHDPAFPESPLRTRSHLEKADIILSLDADLFGPGAADVRHALEFARRRRTLDNPIRLYVVESMPSLTGSMADHRRALNPAEIVAFAKALVDTLGNPEAAPDPWVKALVRDLQAHRGRCLVVAGDFQPSQVHELARTINEMLGSVGATIDYPAFSQTGTTPGSLRDLVEELNAGKVEDLIIFGGNPVYDAPVDLGFADALTKARFALHFGLYRDETAARCKWHAPESHFLESWSDAQSPDGALSIIQPLIEPLNPTHSVHELFAALLGQIPTTGYDIIRAAWKQRHPGDDFEDFWRKTLHDGVTSAPVAQSHSQTAPEQASVPATAELSAGGLQLIIRPDPFVLDGRYANSAWLQELPRPFTKLTWENAAHISTKTAQDWKLEQGDVVELLYRGRKLEVPVWILPGHADGCVTVYLGYGRSAAGRVGNGCGYNAFALQTSDTPWGGAALDLHKTGKRHEFAVRQENQRMEGREPVRVANVNSPKVNDETPGPGDSLLPGFSYPRSAWGMVIDLNTCIGCSACTIACQAENNIPVVGREQVMRGRAMHWIRVDRYYEGAPENPRMYHQPVPCMHCEKAPCELVCPVAATVHDHEGLNLMVYNRCVGTRYCSNNCPYKVRRFNFLQYSDNRTPQYKLMRNPEVTVRMRGVMEKCTYCVQRISAARIAADVENRPIRDGEVVPACAQACPADAITFGDIHDPQSRVFALRKEPSHYALLAELNTRPRTTYLARLRNTNPEIGDL